MWTYHKEIIRIEDPDVYAIMEHLTRFGQEGWDVFQVSENEIDSWTTYSERHTVVEYTLYMKIHNPTYGNN